MIWSQKTQPLTPLAGQGTDSAHVTGQSTEPARIPEKARTDAAAGEEASRRMLLRVVQPGLAGLMDGSVSTLAPIFATAFATHRPFTAFLVGIAAALLAGLGSAFIGPTLGASYLDISTQQHRSVIQGIRESAISFSAVVAPLLATFLSHWLPPQDIFTVAAVIRLSAVIPALLVLKLQDRAEHPARSCDSSVSKTEQLVSAL